MCFAMILVNVISGVPVQPSGEREIKPCAVPRTRRGIQLASYGKPMTHDLLVDWEDSHCNSSQPRV